MKQTYIFQIILLLFLGTGCSNFGNKNNSDQSTSENETSTVVDVDPLMLHSSAMNNDLQSVQTLLVQGVDVNYLDEGNRTALMYASFDGYQDIMESLISSGADLDLCDLNGRTALMFAASGPFPDAVRLLLDSGAKTNIQESEEHFTALMYAASEGQLENVKLLIEYGADPSLEDVDGDNALVFAKNNNHQEVVSFLEGL